MDLLQHSPPAERCINLGPGCKPWLTEKALGKQAKQFTSDSTAIYFSLNLCIFPLPLSKYIFWSFTPFLSLSPSLMILLFFQVSLSHSHLFSHLPSLYFLSFSFTFYLSEIFCPCLSISQQSHWSNHFYSSMCPCVYFLFYVVFSNNNNTFSF